MALPALNEEQDDKELIKVNVVEPDLSGMQKAIKIIADNTKPIKTSAAAESESRMEEAAKQKTLLDLFREMRDGIKGIGQFKKESPKDWTALILGIGIGAIVALVAFFKELWISTKNMIAVIGYGGKAVWGSVKAVFSLIRGVGGFADDLLGNWPSKVIKGAFTAIKNAFVGETSVFKTIGTKFATAKTTFLESKFVTAFDDVFKGIKTAFSGEGTVFKTIGTKFATAKTAFLESKFVTAFDDVFKGIKGTFSGEASVFKTIGTKFATAKATFLQSKFVTAIDDVFKGAKTAFSGEATVWKTIGSKFDDALKVFKEAKIGTKVTGLFTSVRNAFTGPKGILTTITAALPGGKPAAGKPIGQVMKGLVPGTGVQKPTGIASKMANAGTAIRNALLGPGDELGGVLGKMVTNFKTAVTNFKAEGIGAKFALVFKDIGRSFTSLKALFGVGGGVPGVKLGFLGHIKNVITWVGSIFNPIKTVVSTIINSKVLQGVITFAKGFGSIIGKLVWPITILMGVWDLVTGFMESFKETGSIWEGLKGGFTKAINTIIGLPLDMLWQGLTWLAKKFGFEELAGMMGKLDFQAVVKSLVAFPFDAISALVGWIKMLFTDPLGAFRKLWNGLFGGSGIVTWIWDNTFGALFGAIGRWFEKNIKIPDIGKMVMDLLPDNKAGRWIGKILGILPDEDLKEAVEEGGQTLKTAKKAGLWDPDMLSKDDIDRGRIEAGISTGLVQAPMLQAMLASGGMSKDDTKWLEGQLKSLATPATKPATDVAGGDVSAGAETARQEFLAAEAVAQKAHDDREAAIDSEESQDEINRLDDIFKAKDKEANVARAKLAEKTQPQETVAGTPAAVADEFTAEGKISWATGDMGTLYFNEAQIEKYNALETAARAIKQEADQIQSAAEAKLKQELTAAGVFSGKAFFMDDDDPRKAQMMAREQKIKDDAAKMIKEGEDASLLFLNQMKRDKETQDKLRKSWEDRGKKKKVDSDVSVQPSETIAGTSGAPDSDVSVQPSETIAGTPAMPKEERIAGLKEANEKYLHNMKVFASRKATAERKIAEFKEAGGVNIEEGRHKEDLQRYENDLNKAEMKMFLAGNKQYEIETKLIELGVDPAAPKTIAEVAAEQAKSDSLIKPSGRGGQVVDLTKIQKLQKQLNTYKRSLGGIRPGRNATQKENAEKSKLMYQGLIRDTQTKLDMAMGKTSPADLAATTTIETAASDATKSVIALSTTNIQQASTTYGPQTSTNLYPVPPATDPHTIKQAQHTMY